MTVNFERHLPRVILQGPSSKRFHSWTRGSFPGLADVYRVLGEAREGACAIETTDGLLSFPGERMNIRVVRLRGSVLTGHTGLAVTRG